MAQNPLQVDQVQIEPGASGTRLIRRAADGSLEFLDAVVTGGITLAQLAGLRSVGQVLVVGKSGAGAEYTAIQSALDAIPASAGPTEPYFVIIGPGVYKETLNLVRDNVHLIGFGAVLQSAAEDTPNGPGAYHTLVIQAALGTVPKRVSLTNLRITNAHDSYAAVRIAGAAGSEVGENGIFLVNCNLASTGSGRPVWATSANIVVMQGGTMGESGDLALVFAEECARFVLDGVLDIPNLQLDYDSAGDVPSIVTSEYKLVACSGLGRGTLSPQVRSTLSGAGSLTILGCDGAPDLSLAGDRAVSIRGSVIGDISLAGSVALSLSGSERGSVTPGGTATLAEPLQWGDVAVAGTSQAVAFQTPHPDNNYTVDLELASQPANNDPWWITNKTATGFTVNFTTAQALNATWTVRRVLGGAKN